MEEDRLKNWLGGSSRASGRPQRMLLAQADRERGTRPVLRLLPDDPAGRSSGNSRTRSTAPWWVRAAMAAASAHGGTLDQVVLSVLGTLTVYGIAERYRSVRQGWPMV